MINQYIYIIKILKEFKMKNSKSVLISIDSYKYIKLTLKDELIID